MQKVEQKIVGRVFSLGDRTVESIMTFRSEMVWIDTAMTPEQIREQVNREPHNRYPAGEGSLDKLAGVVYLKDLFRHIDDPGFDIRNHLSPAKFFHEGAEVYSALEQFRSEQLGYGIVCDEFGVTRGIVTLKDIFEALVGAIPEGSGGARHRTAGGRQRTHRRAVSVLRFPGLLRRWRTSFPEQSLQHPQRPDPRPAGAYSRRRGKNSGGTPSRSRSSTWTAPA